MDALPDTNPKSRFGMSKPGISSIAPVALLHCGRAMDDGANKYGLMNWREHQVSASVYYNAGMRHFMSWWDGEQCASDSGVHHLGHVMACCAIILDAEHSGSLNDDRPTIPGPFSRMVAEMTRSLGAAPSVEDAISMIAERAAESPLVEADMAELEKRVLADPMPVVGPREPMEAGELAARILGVSTLEEAQEMAETVIAEEEALEYAGHADGPKPDPIYEVEFPHITSPEQARKTAFNEAMAAPYGQVKCPHGLSDPIQILIRDVITAEELQALIHGFINHDIRNLTVFNNMLMQVGEWKLASYNQEERSFMAFLIDCHNVGGNLAPEEAERVFKECFALAQAQAAGTD